VGAEHRTVANQGLTQLAVQEQQRQPAEAAGDKACRRGQQCLLRREKRPDHRHQLHIARRHATGQVEQQEQTESDQPGQHPLPQPGQAGGEKLPGQAQRQSQQDQRVGNAVTAQVADRRQSQQRQ